MIEYKAHMTPADVAYQLMKEETRAMESRDLIEAVIQIMDLPADDPQVKSMVYTGINLDPRMVFLGKGIWGIRDWSPMAVAAATTMPDLLPGEKSYQPKPVDYLWDDEDDSDEDDEEEEKASEVEENEDDPE